MFARVVERLRESRELLADPAHRLPPDVEDAGAHHEAERLEADLLHEEELVDGEVAREEVMLPHREQALARVLRQIVWILRGGLLGPLLWLRRRRLLSGGRLLHGGR